MFTTYLCQVTYIESLIKRLFDVSLRDTTAKGKSGDVMILLVVDATFQGM